MKKNKWPEKQWNIVAVVVILFTTWYIIGTRFLFKKTLIYESEIFSILVGITITSGVILIINSIKNTKK